MIKTYLRRGFTVVELLVVIAAIGILATVGVVGYGKWRESVAKAEVQSDIKAAFNAMEQEKNFGAGYPNAIPTSFKSSPNVEVRYVSGDGDNICIEAVSLVNPDISYFIKTSETTEPRLGTCAGGEGSQPPGGGGDLLVADVAPGGTQACVLIQGENSIYCAGRNEYGALGNGNNTDSSSPVAVDMSGVLSGKTVTSIDAGNDKVCALTTEGRAYCWGNGRNGQLGSGGPLSGAASADSNVPVAVVMSGALSGKTITQIGVGNNHSCVIASDNKAYCWGQGVNYELGNGGTASSTVPVAVSTSGVLSGRNLSDISVGNFGACVVATNGRAYCWGFGFYGELGNGSSTSSSVPVAVSTAGVLNGKTVTKVSTAGRASCALTTEGRAYCWGTVLGGSLGNGSTTSSNVPVAVSTSGALSGKTLTDIVVSGWTICGLSNEGKVYCWGADENGTLGNGSGGAEPLPVAIDVDGKTVSKIYDATGSTCALTTDNKAYCWGYNGYGRFGNGNADNSLVPVEAFSSL